MCVLLSCVRYSIIISETRKTAENKEAAHEWDFWDRYIEKAIEWLPTDDTVEGLGSGNIGDR